jgi:hypothetical protein
MLTTGGALMPDTTRDVSQQTPRKVCRKTEAHETAILTLALRSLNAVKAEHDASWPFRVHPLRQISRSGRVP